MINLKHYCIASVLLLAGIVAPCQSFAVPPTLLHAFKGKNDGEFPEGGVIIQNGIIYGTTFGTLVEGERGKKCPKSCGSAYGFDLEQNDRLRQTLHFFFQAEKDGAFPTGELLLQDNLLYGTTEFGPGSGCDGLGCGTAFAIDPASGDEQKPLHFCEGNNCSEGEFPQGTLTADTAKNIYGATTFGGKGRGYLCGSAEGGCGVIFEITGKQKTAIHSFCMKSKCEDGAVPNGKLVIDAAGNIFGTTQFGGARSQGTIFELSHDGTFSVLYSFCSNVKSKVCADGAIPVAGLTEDSSGNLYGTAKFGGEKVCGLKIGCGVVFELPLGAQSVTVLHTFGDRSGGTDGAYPEAAVTLNSSGNLFGTTLRGGNGSCGNVPVGCGTLYEIPAAGGYAILYDFDRNPDKITTGYGIRPQGTLWWNESDGLLYGTTRDEGDPTCLCGTLYSLDPSGAGPKGARSHRPGLAGVPGKPE